MKTLDNGRRTCRKEIQFMDEELTVIEINYILNYISMY